jgi:hypothetical protein
LRWCRSEFHEPKTHLLSAITAWTTKWRNVIGAWLWRRAACPVRRFVGSFGCCRTLLSQWNIVVLGWSITVHVVNLKSE